MKNRIRLFHIVPAMIALLLLATGDLLAQRNSTTFTGAMNAAGPGFLVACGEFTCPGGQPTADCYGPPPNSLTPCSEGSNFHQRRREHLYVISTSDERVSGTISLDVNWNWRHVGTLETPFLQHLYSGPMWGTFILNVTENDDPTGEVWEGTYVGEYDGYAGIGTFSMVGHGNGDSIEGLQIKLDFSGPVWGGEVHGRILKPRGKGK